MIENFEGMKKQLSELATVLNGFKSEAVQLRILELVFDESATTAKISPELPKVAAKPRKRHKKTVDNTSSSVPGKRRKVASGEGAVANLTALLSTDFFNKPRTISDIIAHFSQHYARAFKANEFSGKLARMVRAKELTREKNANNQYEYKKR